MDELKIDNSNEESFTKVILQSDEAFDIFKATYGHATKNVLKSHNFLIDGLPTTFI